MFRIILVLILIAAILAFKFLPWYVLVALVVLMVFGLKFFGRKLFEWLFSLPFRAKGAALRNATVAVHFIVPCAAPERPPEESRADQNGHGDEDPDDEDPDAHKRLNGAVEPELIVPRNYYRVEATITPASKKQLFDHWEIGELRLVPPDYDPFKCQEDEACPVESLEVQLEGAFTPDDGYKLMGPQRLRFVVGVRPGVSKMKFNYYFEKFGELAVPA